MAKEYKAQNPADSEKTKAAPPQPAPKEAKPEEQAGHEQKTKDADGLELAPPSVLEALFPDVSTLLIERPTFAEMFKNAIFVLDANALFRPYQLTSGTADKTVKLLAELSKKGRLRVPAHALREFFRRLASKVSQRYNSSKEKLGNAAVMKAFEFPLVPQEKIAAMNAASEKAVAEIRKIIEPLEQWNYDDRIFVAYRDLITSNTIISPTESSEFLVKEAVRRAGAKIPPGYGDKDKGANNNAEGDVVLWYSMLALGKTTDVIFISHDINKQDWVYGKEGSALFPRPELVDEFYRLTGHHFYMITLSKLLDLSKVEKDAVSEVQSAEANDISSHRKWIDRGYTPGVTDPDTVLRHAKRLLTLAMEATNLENTNKQVQYLIQQRFQDSFGRLAMFDPDDYAKSLRSQFVPVVYTGQIIDRLLSKFLHDGNLSLNNRVLFNATLSELASLNYEDDIDVKRVWRVVKPIDD